MVETTKWFPSSFTPSPASETSNGTEPSCVRQRGRLRRWPTDGTKIFWVKGRSWRPPVTLKTCHSDLLLGICHRQAPRPFCPQPHSQGPAPHLTDHFGSRTVQLGATVFELTYSPRLSLLDPLPALLPRSQTWSRVSSPRAKLTLVNVLALFPWKPDDGAVSGVPFSKTDSTTDL